MKINPIIRIIAFLLLGVSVYLTYTQMKAQAPAMATKNDCVIIIDAGHGGADGGAVAADGTMEKDINLQIANKLKEYFELAGFYTEMSRSEDVENIPYSLFNKAQDMENRLILMNSFPNAVVISIHQNNFTDTEYSGAQVFYTENLKESKCLAECIQGSIRQNLQPDNEREALAGNENSMVLSEAENYAVIVECGFLSNPYEAKLLKNSEYQSKMAFSIFDGVTQFLNYQE